MQDLTEKIDNNGTKWNPSLQEVASRLHYGKKVIRYGSKRESVLNGKKTIVQSLDTTEVIEDNEQFIKLYLNDVNAVKKYNELSSTAQKLLNYVFNKINHNEDYFYKLDGEIEKYTGLTYSVIYKGFKELIESKWIYKADIKLKYWINISLFFKGDRQRIIDNYYKMIK